MSQTARKQATYQDVLNAPPHMVAEIVDGQLELSPRPAIPHGFAKTALGIKLGGPFQYGERDGPGGWQFIMEPELHLVGNVLVPDLAGWRRDRMPVVPDEVFLTLAPDWICEVLSPSTSRFDRMRKMPAYARAGVAHAWLLNPRERTLEAFVLVGTAWQLLGTFGDEDPVRIPPFDAVELDLKRVWGEPLAAP